MKTVLLITFALFNLVSFGQDNTKKIKKVKTVDQANAFIKANPNLKGEIIQINSGTDSSAIAKKIIEDKSGNPIIIEAYTYKVIEIKKSSLLRASYINLLGDKYSIHQIDSIRKVIIAKYNNGIPFSDLAKEYNTDGNPNCDLGWVPEEMLITEFSTAIKEHKTGDLFTIDAPCNSWYYVTLKTFDDREVKIYSVLKIKSAN